MNALANHNSTGAGTGSPGFTSGLGGAAAGVDIPLTGTLRTGFALATADGQTWTQMAARQPPPRHSCSATGSWQSGALFATTQVGGMFQQENISRPQPVFGNIAKGSTNGFASSGSLSLGIMHPFGAWLLEPSVGIDGFSLREGDRSAARRPRSAPACSVALP